MTQSARTRGLAETHIHEGDGTAVGSTYTCEAGYAAMMRWYATSLAELRVPYESISVSTRYGDTHLLAAGPQDAPSVILLHGMEGTALGWKPQITALHSAFRVYAPDIIGSCGKSAPVRLSHANGEYGEWLGDVMTGLHVERASFAGVSSGGWMVMKLAAHAPERIEKAVLMSASGLVPMRFPFTLARYFENDAIRGIVEWLAGRLLTRGAMRWAISRFVLPRGIMPPPELVEWFYLLTKYYRYRYPPGPVSDGELRMLRAPTLLLMGEHEHIFDVHAAVTRARALLPDLRAAEIIPNVGHNMAADNPDLINARLTRFLYYTR